MSPKNTALLLGSLALGMVLLGAQSPEGKGKSLLDPSALGEQAPDTFQVKFETSHGNFVIEVHRAWSPAGADRFYNLVKNGFYNDTRFFRLVPGFVVQWGINGDPAVNKVWQAATVKDDPVVESNKRGYITFAKSSAPNSRTTQVFVNYKDNTNLDRMGFSPFGKVTEGMDVVDKLNSAYGEQPNQGKIQAEGNPYLQKQFPELDYIKQATIVGGKPK